MTIAIPGVYAAQRDTLLLDEVLQDELRTRAGTDAPCRVLELGTGSGALAVAAARRPGTEVTAVDVSRRALLSARLAARREGLGLRLRRGDLTAPVAGERFDVVISNPPYVPAPDAEVPRYGSARAWDAGHDGRAVLDRLCVQVPGVLAPGGTVLIVQSALSDVAATRRGLEQRGLRTDEAATCTHPLGPVLSARIGFLEESGLMVRGCRTEDLVVVRGRC